MRSLLILLLVFSGSIFAKEVIRIPHPDYPGYLYMPKDAAEGEFKFMPGIFMLHGSEGGWGDYWNSNNVDEAAPTPTLARELASQGYVTFVMTYFDNRLPGYEDLTIPTELAFIDLKQTYQVMQWFQKTYVGNNNLTLLGYSRGAEQALLLSSLIMNDDLVDPNNRIIPNQIIALSPSHMVHRGISDSLSRVVHGEDQPKVRFDLLPAWRWGATVGEVGLGDTDTRERTFLQGDQFDLGPFPNPILVTSFTKDPAWLFNTDITDLWPLRAIQSPERLLFIEPSEQDFENGRLDAVMNALNSVPARGRVFVNYPGQGHGVTSPEQTNVLLKFINQTEGTCCAVLSR